jgi:excinuclease ABC subunit A
VNPNQDFIEIIGAREHNLKNVDLTIPRNSLVVFTGLSGSGKSSLAFDTIFAEGQRRYLESFSAYARQFIGDMKRPDVDKINGLSPAISIEQKTVSKNPRSTVGTITEIYDFLRLLYARAGIAYSYKTGKKMKRFSEGQIISTIDTDFSLQKIAVLAPLVRGRKGHYKELFQQLARKGFTKVRIDGELTDITGDLQLDRYKIHDIELVIDRMDGKSANKVRIREAVQTGLKMGKGSIMVLRYEDNELFYFSRNLMDALRDNWTFTQLRAVAKHMKFSLADSINKITTEQLNAVLYGLTEPVKVSEKRGGRISSFSTTFKGVIPRIEEQYYNKEDDKLYRWAEEFMSLEPCNSCRGGRLNEVALHYKLDGKNIADLARLNINDLADWINGVEKTFDEKQKIIGSEVIKEIKTRIGFLLGIGLGYLTLNNPARTLSGGEAQRIRLATQIGSRLVNVLYILDEPSIGLHQRDNARLIESLKKLRDLGNSIIVVEHDKEMIEQADYIVDIGPGAGKGGGEIAACGNAEEFVKGSGLTADYISGRKEIALPKKRRKATKKKLIIKGATGNNLKDITAEFPLGLLICVTGVSGSGKSTLINETLFPILSHHVYRSHYKPKPYKSVHGLEHIDKVIRIDQSPIGRTPRSNPATYTGVFTDIRSLYADIPESKIRGYKPGRFSFNVKGGRCETCRGGGKRTIEMNFLPNVEVLCDTCQGKRYNRETLEVRYRGKSINDVLDMSIDEAIEFFAKMPRIRRKIETLHNVGLGYLTLGQSSTTISGGEAQRVKLASELSKKDTGSTFYLLDEPTTGLHFEDVNVLMKVLQDLVDRGNTIAVIEHNMDVIKLADYIIDMGPEGGMGGGEIIAKGSPEVIIKSKHSATAKFLKAELK